MNLFYTLLVVLQVLFGLHFFMPLILSIAGQFRKPNRLSAPPVEADYAVIVTAYQQVNLIPMVVDSILKADYSNYIIYVVADNCDVSELHFEDPKVVVLRPAEVLASNTKSHFYAINNFKRNHERLTIIDSDNLVHPAYFNALNVVFDQGYEAVQGVRAAKNLDSTYACLDEAGDIYYRLVDRKLMYEAGSSAALSGSGMAFTLALYRSCLEHLEISGAGFDKILQYEILSRGEKIAFAEQAIVYDEKTAKTDQLVNQRSRWINTWFKYLYLGAKLLMKSVSGLNWNQFLFSILLLRPPLFMLLIVSFLFFVMDLLLMPLFALYWVLAVITFFVFVFKALSHFKADDKIYHSLKNAPKFIYFQLLALLKVRKANKISVATEHYYEEKISK
ncbi:glycosyltransferase [Pedobacter gandavensis]|uniref:Glycosyltransferase n=1 Tax=Pedobacter gandavensis TaxID=2679963 RepID=A0ABR6ET35_9SPHI|nr:glycosyltransferase [Pedobacter gandavensis]MBB2148420.1 glycosyltransferase [Pedobacter gandavensis]